MANHFFTLLLLFTTIVFISINNSHCRYLRPSDHGLAYQNTSHSTTEKEDVPEMLSFFKGKRAATATTSLVPNTPLPEARNFSSSGSDNDPAAKMWWRKNHRKSHEGGNGRNHVRQILLLTSFLCGLAGVVLLVVSAFVFIYRYTNRKQQQGKHLTESERRKRTPAVSKALVPVELK